MCLSSIKRILFTTDYSETSDKALPYALELAKMLASKLHILHVVENIQGLAGFYLPHISTDKIDKEIEINAKNMLNDYSKKITKDFNNYELVLLKGDPYKEILNFIETNSIDLVVLATQGRSKLDKLLIGSTAERIIKKAPCHVLKIHS